MFKKNEQAQVVEWEKVAARRLKNGFTEIKEIRFSEEYNYNHLAGFVAVGADIITEDTQDIIELSLPIEEAGAYGYGGATRLKDGKTEAKVKVIYSDLSEEDI
ncbi:hypothetical protein ACYSNR_05960 [Enterococcus sp. LJL128]